MCYVPEQIHKDTPTQSDSKITDSFLSTIPKQPGVYIMKDAKGEILYIGKASNLHARVRSYFRKTGDKRWAVRVIRTSTASIELCLTDTEKEALILENNLIKKCKPYYNIRLKDDKQFLNLRIDLNTEIPKFEYVRHKKEDGAVYFGPYSSSRKLKETMRHLQWLYPLRTCKDYKRRTRPCLMCQMRSMPCPCLGGLSRNEYLDVINEVIMILRGQKTELLKQLKEKMETASDNLEFEHAAQIRDRIHSIEQSLEKQDIISNPRVNKDFIGVFYSDKWISFNVLEIRQGRLEGSDNYMYKHNNIPQNDLLASFIQQLYLHRPIPDSLYVPVIPDELFAIKEWLQDKSGRRINIAVAQRGENVRLQRMADKNSCQNMVYKNEHNSVLLLLQKKFCLRNIPLHMECFDISTFQGDSSVGAQVVFVDGKPQKKLYRRYRIKNIDQQNDFAMMREVFQRRIERAVKEQKFPDLCIIDGGKGQLSAVWSYYKIVKKSIPHIDIIALAKEHKSGEGERIFLPDRKDGIRLRKGSVEKKILDAIRDETHRFAIMYHRNLRKKKILTSGILSIPGVGAYREKLLLLHFGSVKKIKSATLEQLLLVKGIGQKVARMIYDFYHH